MKKNVDQRLLTPAQYGLLALVLVLALASGCRSAKEVGYLQRASKVSPQELQSLSHPYEERILPQDLLVISIYTSDPEATAPFNLMEPSSGTLNSYAKQQTYLVNKEGEIRFPVLGVLKIGGMYKSEAEQWIRGRLKEYLKEEPVITIRQANYRVSVLGEVVQPGSFTVANEKVNVLEALALAGDMTIYGRRDSVLLVRTLENGSPSYHYLNMNDPMLVTSPWYQLQQSDVLYIIPNKSRSRTSGIGSGETLALSSISILLSLISLLYNITR